MILGCKVTIWKDRLVFPLPNYDAFNGGDGVAQTPDESGTNFECDAAGYAPPADYRECRAMEQQVLQNWGPPVFWDIGFGPVGDNQASTIKCECS